ncbi:reverse transcriptase [Bacillus infantis]|uniref:reverse transcriptase domain-containing protein n=1 Tax=Bacillus infantis TaxID=324767 RepID=UPI001CD5AB0C|nr:reverse transcriptase domain-containing protein [Bacillus infantis]MCA1035705.1 reverse transcriptase [Bacillus infantis]
MKQSNRPQKLHNLPSSSEIEWSKYDSKYYLHFDSPIHINRIKSYILEPSWVTSHAFLPSIHFNITFNKYVTVSKDKANPHCQVKEKKQKVRQIFYAAHKDRFIYKYYGDLLNFAYNQYAQDFGIDDIALAYRNNKSGKNNADFAYEVFNYLLSQKQAIILSIDFTKFFDHINHSELKKNIKTVLKVDELPEDWYKVYKNLTQYTYIHKSDIDIYLKQQYGVKKLNELLKDRKLSKIMEPSEFRHFKGKHLYKNKKPYGIHQGSGMSAVCSNVHLIHFDQQIKEWAASKNALYRRYCDDIILVIPTDSTSFNLVEKVTSEVYNIINSHESAGLKVQEEKTEIRIYSDGQILDDKGTNSSLDYLGFVTDGQSVRIREKSLFKYYCRAYRKASSMRRVGLATKRKSPRKELYKIYTHLGFNYKNRGNFITYAYRAHEKMSLLKTKSLIRNQIKRHWTKIHKRL